MRVYGWTVYLGSNIAARSETLYVRSETVWKDLRKDPFALYQTIGVESDNIEHHFDYDQEFDPTKPNSCDNWQACMESYQAVVDMSAYGRSSSGSEIALDAYITPYEVKSSFDD